MTPTRARARWLVPVGVLLVAAVLRLWELGTPHRLVFDEIYYVRDAVTQLAHGFPTDWPDDDPAFVDPAAFTDRASPIAHPPLGKWLIGLGILLFGAESAWGWRIAAALAGIATVATVMRLGWLMSRSLLVTAAAGLLLAVDGVHVALSRVSLLDGFLTALVALGALFIWHDQAGSGSLLRPRRGSALGPILWRRPWLLAAGLAFGAAAAVKWSGLYALAAFLLLVTVRDVILRRRFATRPALGSLCQAAVTGAVALPAALAAYLASWIGWILHPDAQGRSPDEPWWVSLWQWHAHSLSWHATLSAEHPYAARALGWPLALRPTVMYRSVAEQGDGCDWAGGCVATIGSFPNPLVTWGGVVALLLLAWAVVLVLWRAIRSRSSAALRHPVVWLAGFVLVGYLSGWLPWVLTLSRPAVFQFYSVVMTPFAALAFGLVLGEFAGLPPSGRGARLDLPRLFALAGIRLDDAPEAVRGRRIAVAIFVSAALLLGLLFFPLWSAVQMPEWFWRAHLWLPGWR
ncbi:phospholipid carrier-dependent glycosyltransferase [Leucobacter soli]|uniref:Polyprenol-phosphate-mannose--protein mannosyltransferase n=1 Tax=Leucobacter soli TaxID=2812850 RepID=A0A916JUC4_9MICO|nr:phospholipid carrier-dependent glycosyltransferase [Leucobacter soli]CAG7604269.1 putative dolichyl-phosphate-mannose--protein mannosyltransferase [Leucobacter soli]